MKTYLPSLWPRGFLTEPFEAFPREMFARDLPAWLGKRPTTEVGAGIPVMNIAETDGAFEATIEIPGVDEKDIKVSVDGNRLVVSGEKKEETKKDEKDWHVEERTFGSFMRSIALPFEPASDAVIAHYDKGVLHLEIKKPAITAPSVKTIEVKIGAPKAVEPLAAVPTKAA